MNQLLPVLVVVAVVAFIMMRQISKIAHQSPNQTQRSTPRNFEFYAQFSSVIQDHVRAIKQALDSTNAHVQDKFKLLSGKDESEALEKLSDAIRTLVFFETAIAKQKPASEIETELFEVLNNIETFLIEYCENGEELAEELREELLDAYNKIS